MINQTKKACVNCRYYVKGKDDETGECHRYPPENNLWPNPMRAEFCGEFRKETIIDKFCKWKINKHYDY